MYKLFAQTFHFINSMELNHYPNTYKNI